MSESSFSCSYPHISTMVPHLWQLLNDCEKELWQMYSTFVEYPDGGVFYRVGDSVEYCFVIIKGLVKVAMESISGRRYVLHLLGPGHLFGYRVFFSGMRYDAVAECIGSSLVYRVPITVLEDLSYSNGGVCRMLLQDSCADMMDNDRRFINMMHMQSRARMAESLLYLRDICGVRSDGSLNVEPSRRDVAEIANMSVPNAIRTLSAFEEEGLLSLDKKKISLLSVAQLRTIADRG